MIKYYKNMILCSELDYHCLLCEESFENVVDLEKHLLWEKHRRNLREQNIVPKFKQSIHKIKQIHYCEVCNCVLLTQTLQEHIKSDDHKEHKANPELEKKRIGLGLRDGSGSIKFPKLTINRLQWHGINGRKCTLCSDSVDSVNDHITTTKHMVNIIQSQVIENLGHYFRKMNKNFYCFSCGDILNEESFNTHSCKKETSQKATNKVKESKKNKNDEKNKNISDKNKKNKNDSPGFLKFLADIEKDKYDVDIKNKIAKCKLCDADVDATFRALDKHTDTYHEDTVIYIDPVDHGKLRSELAAYGRENFIKLNEGGSKGYCSLCDIYLSASIKVAKGHVNGMKHRGHLELKGLVAHKKHSLPGRRVTPLQHFLRNLFHVPPLNAMCINFNLCVNGLSFMLSTALDNDRKLQRKCYCCDVVTKSYELKEHWNTKKHKDAFGAADVLMMDDEFIRIIRPGLFHCGFCNKVFPFWETMSRHIASFEHTLAKKKQELVCNLALQCYTEQNTSGLGLSGQLYEELIELGII